MTQSVVDLVQVIVLGGRLLLDGLPVHLCTRTPKVSRLCPCSQLAFNSSTAEDASQGTTYREVLLQMSRS